MLGIPYILRFRPLINSVLDVDKVRGSRDIGRTTVDKYRVEDTEDPKYEVGTANERKATFTDALHVLLTSIPFKDNLAFKGGRMGSRVST